MSPDGQTVAVVLDNADGITLDAFDAQQGAVAEFLLELDPETPVVIGSSADGVVFGPSTDRRSALLALGQLRKGGNREWGATLASTLDAAAPDLPVTVVAMSAAPSPPEAVAPPDLAGRLASQGVHVRWINLRDDAGPPADLGAIGPVTPATDENLLATLDVIAADLGSQYVLRFQADPEMSTLVVTFERDGRTWTAEAPISPPKPGDAAPSPRPGTEAGSAAGQEPSTGPADRPAATPAGRGEPASSPDRQQSVLGEHWRSLTAVAAGGLLVGLFAVVTRGRPEGGSDRAASSRPIREAISRKRTERTL